MIRRVKRRAAAWSFPLIRDIILFIAGLAGLAYETVFTKTDRPTLLLLYAAMLGLPAFLQANDARNNDEREIAQRRFEYDEDEDEQAERDRLERERTERRRKDLLEELHELEDRLQDKNSGHRRYSEQDKRIDKDDSIRRLPANRRRSRDDDDDGNGTHGGRRNRR